MLEIVYEQYLDKNGKALTGKKLISAKKMKGWKPIK